LAASLRGWIAAGATAPAPYSFQSDGKCARIFSWCRRFSPAAEFEAAQASCSFPFVLAAAVPPLTDEKLSRAKLREPPLSHSFATRHQIHSVAQLEARFARLLVLSSAPREEDGRFRLRRPAFAAGLRQVSDLHHILCGWIAAGATAPAPKSFHYFIGAMRFKEKKTFLIRKEFLFHILFFSKYFRAILNKK